MGCEGVGAFQFDSGSFSGMNISGCKMAYAVAPGDYIVFYVDAPNAAKHKAVDDLCKTAFKGWGKMTFRTGKIAIHGSNGGYSFDVDGGKVMSLKMSPTLGADKKSAMTYSNINSAMHPTVMQGKVLSGMFSGEGKSFTLKDTNAYFNNRLNVNSKF